MSEEVFSDTESDAINIIVQGNARDPVTLVTKAGCDPSVFFENGRWDGVDFRHSDLSGVSFKGCDLDGAIFSAEQLSIILLTNPSARDRVKITPDPPALLHEVSFHFIGSFRVITSSGKNITPHSSRARAVLAILASEPNRSRSRSWLAGSLWDRVDQDKANASLRQALASIRKSFGNLQGIIKTERSEISIDINRIYVDILDSDNFSEVDELKLLEGLYIESDFFDDWLRMLPHSIKESKKKY